MFAILGLGMKGGTSESELELEGEWTVLVRSGEDRGEDSPCGLEGLVTAGVAATLLRLGGARANGKKSRAAIRRRKDDQVRSEWAVTACEKTCEKTSE